jgi:hypothetical protein
MGKFIAWGRLWRQTRWPHLRRLPRLALGWVCLALGVLGVVLPILPGFPFLVRDYLLDAPSRQNSICPRCVSTLQRACSS